jgi:hypothetical protein
MVHRTTTLNPTPAWNAERTNRSIRPVDGGSIRSQRALEYRPVLKVCVTTPKVAAPGRRQELLEPATVPVVSLATSSRRLRTSTLAKIDLK